MNAYDILCVLLLRCVRVSASFNNNTHTHTHTHTHTYYHTQTQHIKTNETFLFNNDF